MAGLDPPLERAVARHPRRLTAADGRSTRSLALAPGLPPASATAQADDR